MNALLNEIDARIHLRQWLIALDRDGTLVPYADRPELAVVTRAMCGLLGRLSKVAGFSVAIVSARSVAQLQGDFDGNSLILAGNYGLEVRFPDGHLVVQPEAQSAVPYLKQVRDELASQVGFASGAILEDHGYSLCLHWHTVPLPFRQELHRAVQDIAGNFPAIRFKTLSTSYEMVPDTEWDKSDALDFIDAHIEPAANGRSYFYAGDSDADTPAFHWVQSRNGVAVRVGQQQLLGATYRLDQPADLLALLEHIEVKRSCANVQA